MTLRYEGLPSEDLRKQREQGWRYYLGVLGAASAAGKVRVRIAGTLRDYARAGNTDDSSGVARRVTLLLFHASARSVA